MIVVKIELWSAITHKISEIGRMYIANDGTGSAERGDYSVAVCRRNSTDKPQPLDPNGPKATRTGKVTDYPRLAYNVWRLIARATQAAFPDERRPRSGIAPTLDAQVLIGLREAVGYAIAHNNVWACDNTPELEAARAWLAAADADGEP